MHSVAVGFKQKYSHYGTRFDFEQKYEYKNSAEVDIAPASGKVNRP